MGLINHGIGGLLMLALVAAEPGATDEMVRKLWDSWSHRTIRGLDAAGLNRAQVTACMARIQSHLKTALIKPGRPSGSW